MTDFILGFQNAAVDMEKAVSELEESGVDSYILDLRNNPVCVRFFFASLDCLVEE